MEINIKKYKEKEILSSFQFQFVTRSNNLPEKIVL